MAELKNQVHPFMSLVSGMLPLNISGPFAFAIRVLYWEVLAVRVSSAIAIEGCGPHISINLQKGSAIYLATVL